MGPSTFRAIGLAPCEFADTVARCGSYYDAGEGRWTQMDTLDAPLDPSNANRYAYAANNPINYVDPTGRAADAWGTLGGLFNVVDAVGIFGDALGGDVKSAASSTFGLILGGVTGLACEALVVAAAAPTAGASLFGSAGCAVIGSAVGTWGTNYARQTAFR